MQKQYIIDAHAHVGLHKPDSNAQNLHAAMKAAGISKTAVFASTLDEGVSHGQVFDAIAPFSGDMFAVGAYSPDKTMEFHRSLETLDTWLADGTIRAIKFYTGYEWFYPADERLRPVMKLLIKHKRPAIFHTGDLVCGQGQAKLKYADPLTVDDLAAEEPELYIIIAHLGSPWVVDCAQVCYSKANVYADCSGFVYGDFSARHARRMRKHVSDFDFITESNGKVLFGTDWPISNHQSYVDTMLKAVPKKYREAVFHGNAQQLFGL